MSKIKGVTPSLSIACRLSVHRCRNSHASPLGAAGLIRPVLGDGLDALERLAAVLAAVAIGRHGGLLLHGTRLVLEPEDTPGATAWRWPALLGQVSHKSYGTSNLSYPHAVPDRRFDTATTICRRRCVAYAGMSGYSPDSPAAAAPIGRRASLEVTAPSFSNHVREGTLSGKYRLVEEVVSFIRHQSSRANVWILVVTAGCGRYASRGAYPLDINGLREPGPPSRTWLRSHHLEQQPGNRTRPNETGIGGRCDRSGPYRAGIPGVLPCGTGQVLLIRVGTQEMRDDLPPEFEQGLRLA
jgi:hypothetical protein